MVLLQTFRLSQYQYSQGLLWYSTAYQPFYGRRDIGE